MMLPVNQSCCPDWRFHSTRAQISGLRDWLLHAALRSAASAFGERGCTSIHVCSYAHPAIPRRDSRLIAPQLVRLTASLTNSPCHAHAHSSLSFVFMVVHFLPILTRMPHLLPSLFLMHVFRYPSKVFVGDTFCYFAGMAFAVVGIHGHFTKPLLLFFLPQVANFVYSVPQLFKFVPCPRHRLPVPLEPTKSTTAAAVTAAANALDRTIRSPVPLMVPSTFPSKPGQHGFWKKLHGLPLSADSLPNFTVLNLMLRILGPTSERGLCVALLVLQAASCAAALTLRFSPFASYLFDG